MPWSLNCTSVHENALCETMASRLSSRPVRLSGAVTLDGSRLSTRPAKLNASGYTRPAVLSVQLPDMNAGPDSTLCIAPEASTRRSSRVVSRGATKTAAPGDTLSCRTSSNNWYRP